MLVLDDTRSAVHMRCSYVCAFALCLMRESVNMYLYVYAYITITG
jgi:hypothetical protein